MITKSAAYVTALTAKSAVWRFGVDILGSDATTPLETLTDSDGYSAPVDNASNRLVPNSGNITLDVTSKIQRTLQIDLRSSDGRYLPGAAGYPSGGAGSPIASGLVWFNTFWRPWITLRTGFDATGAEVWDTTYLGLFVLTDPTTQVDISGTIVTLSLSDLSALLSAPYVVTAPTLPTYTDASGVLVGGYPAGSNVANIIANLATRGGIPARLLTITNTGATLGTDYPIQENDEWWPHMQKLAASITCVLYFDAYGNLVLKPDPTGLTTTPVWTYTPGSTSTIATLRRATSLGDTYNHIIVIGAGSDSTIVRGEAILADLASPYNHTQIGDRVAYWGQNGLGDTTPDPTITTTAQATARAGALLATHIGQQETVALGGRPDPRLEPWDRVAVDVAGAGLATDMLVQAITWPLGVNAMSLTAYKWLASGS